MREKNRLKGKKVVDIYIYIYRTYLMRMVFLCENVRMSFQPLD